MQDMRHSGAGKPPRQYAVFLGIFTALFALRVVGQAVVAVADMSFLPPFERWYSGLLPYWLLLPLQIALLGLMIAIARDFGRGSGYFLSLTPRTGRLLRILSCLYAFAMAARYVVTMALHPELRWFTGTIPIWFHFVLASFLFTFGHYHATRSTAPNGVAEP
jgi:hypothetical protein